MSSNDLRAAGRIGLVAAGHYFGGPVGGAVGALAGNLLLPNELPDQHVEGPRLSDLKITTSAYGQPIRIVYSNMRLAGNIIWSTDIQEHATTTTSSAPGGKGGGPPDITTTSYTHTISFFVAFCEGPGTALSRIWADGKLIYDNRSTASIQSHLTSVTGVSRMTFYDGAATQKPDSFMVARDGDAPAYRGITGIFFENMQIDGYGNRIPNIEAEIFGGGTAQNLEVVIDNSAQYNGPQLGTVCPDGLLIAAVNNNLDQTFSILALLDPFTGLRIKQYSLPASLACAGGPPVRNTAGDIVYFGAAQGEYIYWPASGSPVLVRDMLQTPGATADFRLPPFCDEKGDFYGTYRYISGGNQCIIWRISNATKSASIVTYIPPFPGAWWYNYDGKITVTIDPSGGSNFNPMLLSEYSTNGILLRSVTTTSITGTGSIVASGVSICVAGDGAVFMVNNQGGSQLVRIDPSWATRTQLTFDSSDLSDGRTGLTRDWSTGDVIYGRWTGARRFASDGTLLKSYSISVSLAGLKPQSHPSFPKRIYLFSLIIQESKWLFYLADNVVTAGTTTLASVITDLCARCGLNASDIDVAALTSTNCDGFVISSQMTVRAALEHLMRAYFLDAVETAGKLKFLKRGGSSVATITEVDLISERSDAGDYEHIIRTAELELPNEVSVSFLDSATNYVQNSQFDRRLTRTSVNKTSLQLPLALTKDKAKQIASTLLYAAWVGRTRHRFATSRKYSYLEPGDVITLSINSMSTIVRITDMRDQGSSLAFEATEDDPTIYTQTTIGGDVVGQPSTVSFSGPTNMLLLDVSLLDTNDDYGLYAAAGGYVTGWPGGKIFKSSDAGATYSDTGKAFATECVIGTCTTTLPPYAGGNVFDESQSLTVVLTSGALSSTTQLEAQGDENLALIGREVVSFVTATLTATNTYVLTTLLRGRLGTGWAMAQHQPGEQFVLLDDDLLRNLVMSSAEVGAARYFKAVTFGENLSSTGPQAIAFAANRLKPSPPSQAGGGRNNSLDIILNWTRSVRGPSEWRDFVDLPLDEPTESYEVDWFGGTTTTITSISLAGSGLVTTSGAHGRLVGDKIFITGVAGMTNINNRAFTILTVPTTTTFTIDENTSGYTAGTGGVYRVRRTGGAVTSTTPTYNYTAASQTTDFGSAQSPAYYAIYQMSSRVGRGYPTFGQI